MLPPSVLNLYATFSASIRSVGTAVAMAGVGVYLHQRNFVSSEGKRTLARISQQVTFPLFLFTKICYCNQDWSSEPCPDVTSSLKDVWVLLFWPAVVVGIGLSVGYGAATVAGAPKSQFRSVLAACGFGNSTGLPITLLTVVHANFPATSDLGRIDPTLFLSVYLLLYPVLQWGVGGWLLAPEETEEEKQELQKTASLENAESGSSSGGYLYPLSPKGDGITHSLGRNVLNNKEKESFYRLSRKAMGETDASLYISDADLVSNYVSTSPEPSEAPALPELSMGLSMDPNSPEKSGNGTYQGRGTWLQVEPPLSPIQDQPIDAESTVTDNDHDQFSPIPPVGSFEPPNPDETTGLLPPNGSSCENYPSIRSSTSKPRDSIRSTKSQYEGETLCETCNKIMTRCFQPPVVGALAGLFFAATPLRGVLVDLVDRSSDAPLQWLFDGLYAVGQAAVPINMIILGCNLSASHQTRQSKKKNDGVVEVHKGDSAPQASNSLSQKTMIAIVVSKMLIMPLIGMLLAEILETYILDIPDEIAGSFYLVLMIVFITPTANNVMVMVELSGSNTKEGIAQVIALQYACAPLMLSLTMSLVVGMASGWS